MANPPPDPPPQTHDLLIDKTHGNAFEETTLPFELEALGVKHVVVTGLVSHGCVRATSLGALAHGLAVTLVADGHSSYAKDAASKITAVNAQLAGKGIALAMADEVTFSQSLV